MGLVSGIVVFLLAWWMVLFAVLPWGLKRDEKGVPLNMNLKRKLMQTTAIAFGIWLVIYGLVEADLVSFREKASVMSAQDHLE